MILEYAVPGLVTLAKATVRGSTGVAMPDISFTKGLISLPTDLVFLSFSFASISLARVSSQSGAKDHYLWFAAFVITISIVATFIYIACQKISLAFDNAPDNQNAKWIRGTVLCYAVAFASNAAAIGLVVTP